MKKYIGLILSLLICLISVSVCAEGKLKATEKIMIIYDGKDSGRFYAKVENVGDAPIGTDSGDLVAFSDDDEIILSKSYVTTMPSYVVLEPGDYLYVNEFLWDSALKENSIADYKFSISGDKRTKKVVKVPCEAKFELDEPDSFKSNISITVTAPNDKPLENFYAVVALHDAEGALIYVDVYTTSTIIVQPGSSITIKLSIDNDNVKYYKAHGIVPVSVDAMVCYTE